jgi:glutamate dehydrogenase (NAD(P)+)
MDRIFKCTDELGPAKILHVYEPAIQLKAVLVVDNVAAGPSIGGIRMAVDVSTEECVRLARAMTLKNAAANLSHGGGKVVVYGDPKMPRKKKEVLIRGLAQALRDIKEYILAPDMGTDEQCMAWIKDEVDRVVGLPAEIGGIPLDEIGATGWGLNHATEVALRYCDFEMNGARLVVQGFGAVGRHAASFMTANGAVLVGVADSQGAIHDPAGLDVRALLELKKAGKSVTDYPGGQKLAGDALIDLECDIWIPAARPDVIHEDNVERLRTRLVVQGANIPVTPAAEQTLHEKGVLCIPDFIANAGGVICAAMEYQGAGETAAMQAIQEKIRRNTEEVLAEMKSRQILPRQAAVELALGRIRKAMSFKRFTIY